MAISWIYALTYFDFASRSDYEDECLSEISFYVGVTTNIKKRMSEHKFCAKIGKMNRVYQKIRDLAGRNIDWEYEILEEFCSGNTDKHPERVHMERLTMEGHPLTNMRCGLSGKMSKNRKVSRSRGRKNSNQYVGMNLEALKLARIENGLECTGEYVGSTGLQMRTYSYNDEEHHAEVGLSKRYLASIIADPPDFSALMEKYLARVKFRPPPAPTQD